MQRQREDSVETPARRKHAELAEPVPSPERGSAEKRMDMASA